MFSSFIMSFVTLSIFYILDCMYELKPSVDWIKIHPGTTEACILCTVFHLGVTNDEQWGGKLLFPLTTSWRLTRAIYYAVYRRQHSLPTLLAKN